MQAFDEMLGHGGLDGPLPDPARVRAAYAHIADWLARTPPELLETRQRQAELFFRRIGITFAVYGDPEATERLIPFDIVPRVLSGSEWARLAEGLEQRVNALNAFIADVYGPQESIRAGVVPADLVDLNPQFCHAQMGVRPAADIWVHIAGIDLVRTGPDSFHVLEDNARTPSGVSYMIENREVMLRLVPELLGQHGGQLSVQPVETYPEMLLDCLKSVAPPNCRGEPCLALLTPGIHNSAYYEHSFLADKLGIELVEGPDLFVDGDILWMRTTGGPQRVDVLYRRVDDDFLDPLVFRPDSILGVPGLVAAHHAGNLTIANAIGTGIADDKAIYSYMDGIVRFFTGRDPIIPNVETWRCREPEALEHVLAHLPELVVKRVDGSGGYGMLVGPTASAAELHAFRRRLIAEPDRYIAQPTLALSTCPTLTAQGIAPRHVDLRPFVLSGANGVTIVPGGLTRVALREGSLVVNSSQGGGTKDTWVLADGHRPGELPLTIRPDSGRAGSIG